MAKSIYILTPLNAEVICYSFVISRTTEVKLGVFTRFTTWLRRRYGSARSLHSLAARLYQRSGLDPVELVRLDFIIRSQDVSSE